MNTSLTAQTTEISRILDTIKDPLSGQGLVTAGRVQGVHARADGRVSVVLEAPVGAEQFYETARAEAERRLGQAPGIEAVNVVLTSPTGAGGGAGVTRVRKGAPATAQQANAAPAKPMAGLPGVRAVIAVASAKGGVGKSTVAVNLACAFASLGLKTGLLDCDVYGPSAPTLLGLGAARPRMRADQKLEPLRAFGLHTMSIGYLVEIDAPMIWRGPMATSAVRQMLDDVAWDDLDLLVLDMPPGTGDIQLTIAQRLSLAGAVIVSTPQEVALADVRRGITMFEKTAVPILGVIENMAWLEQDNGVKLHVFGQGGAEKTARAFGAPFLGHIPIDLGLRESGDAGAPLVAARPDHPISARFRDIASAALSNMAAAQKPAPTIRFEG
jgi:ATP-binding protein involved in chromosome partitioning